MKRKAISQKTRKAVYEKYGGHCAYCGCELDYKDMQVDHVDSCSTMHTIHKRDFHFEDFSSEHMRQITEDVLRDIIRLLNKYRGEYVETGNKDAWWQIIQLLPESYNQMRTVTMTYENAYSMIHQRAGHKLDEWRTFVEILKELPYMKELLNTN